MYNEQEAKRIYDLQMELAYASILYEKLEKITNAEIAEKPSVLLTSSYEKYVIGKFVEEEGTGYVKDEIEFGCLDRADDIMDQYNPPCKTYAEIINLPRYIERIDIAEKYSEKEKVKEVYMVILGTKVIENKYVFNLQKDCENYLKKVIEYSKIDRENKEEIQAVVEELLKHLDNINTLYNK